MLTQRYQVAVLFILVALCGVYLLLPLSASYLLTRGLRAQGYSDVMLQLGYPGWTHMRIPVVSFHQDLGEERLMVSLTETEIRYDLGQLLQGRVNQILLRDAAVHVLNVQTTDPPTMERKEADRASQEESPWRLLTAGDLLRNLPILPFNELQIEHLTIFREQATGPLRKVTITGGLTYSGREVGGRLSFRGRDTGSYGLAVSGNSASTWSATLSSQQPQAEPIVSWWSQAHPTESRIQVSGQLRINVQELAPFIALLVPIGPELERVTGQVAIDWAGVAAAQAALGSLWEDRQTHLDGHMRVNITLPALKGIAKDIALAYMGSFGGNATQAEWAMSPGVLLTATINTQPRIIPEAVRLILPHGDQPVRIENKEPVQGILYWKETPIRTVTQGPLHVTYGKTPGPLVAQFKTTRAEGRGNELVSAEGGYQLEGLLPKAIADRLSAKEAVGGVRGTIKLDQTHVKGVLLPPSSVTAKQIGHSAVFMSGATLHLSEPLTIECDVAAVHCNGGPLIATIRVPTMRIRGRNVSIAQGIVKIQEMETRGTAWATRGILSLDRVSWDPLIPVPSPTTWVAKVSADQTAVQADLRIDLPTFEGLVTARVEHSLQTQHGVLHGSIGPLTFNSTDRRLSKLMTGVAPSIDLLNGSLSATVDASWTRPVNGQDRETNSTSVTATVVADNVAGHYDDYGIKGVSTTLRMRSEDLESIVMVQPASLVVTSVQSGVDVTNVRASYQARWRFADERPVVEVKDVRCEIFGGTITSPGAVVDLTSSPSAATFSLQNLDLAKILSVEQQRGLQGTGTLNGTLPVTITSKGVTVRDGVVEAQPPGGIIRYLSTTDSSKALVESDRQLQLVTQALNNFHYTLLRVGVRYGENGMLDLSARLEGRNPDLHQTPPIHFNLTVQEHIPTLLKSLRLIEDIHGMIERQYRRP